MLNAECRISYPRKSGITAKGYFRAERERFFLKPNHTAAGILCVFQGWVVQGWGKRSTVSRKESLREYPNKKGKSKAFKHYFTWIKGKEYCGKKVKLTARQMWYAVQNYIEEINLKGTQPQYIKHGDTFFNNIVEYVREGDDS